MKNGFLCLVFSILSSIIFGQNIELKRISLEKKDVAYWSYKSQSQIKKTLIAIIDSNSSNLGTKSWCDALIPFAEKNVWQIIVPIDIHKTKLSAFLSALNKDSIASEFVFITKDETEFAAFSLVELGIGGIIISPGDSITQIKSLKKVPIVIVRDKSEDQHENSILKELNRQGHWTKLETQSSSRLEGNYKWFNEQLSWVDSIQQLLNDSIAFDQWKQDAGLLSEIPEVVRQGSPVDLKIKMAEPSQISIELLDLSANSVWKFEQYLGIGIHEISIPTRKLEWGVYKLELKDDRLIKRSKIMIRG